MHLEHLVEGPVHLARGRIRLAQPDEIFPDAARVHHRSASEGVHPRRPAGVALLPPATAAARSGILSGNGLGVGSEVTGALKALAAHHFLCVFDELV